MNDLLADLNIQHNCDVPLGPLTWYGVGGNAEIMAYPSSVQQLAALANHCHSNEIPMYVLGRGANLLVSDKGVKGVVIRLNDASFKQMTIKDNIVEVGGGYDLAKLVLDTAKAGLSGLEVLAGIPATVGGAIRMNAGGAYGDIGQSVLRVQVMDASGQVYYRDRDDLLFSYRTTNIVARFIISAEFDLTPDDPDELIKRVKEIFLYKKNTQPLADDSAGCAFKNPPADVVPEGIPASAGALIDRAGLKGDRIGGAYISEKHANFIGADKSCKASDILELMAKVEQEVLEKFGVKLQREVVVWGE